MKDFRPISAENRPLGGGNLAQSPRRVGWALPLPNSLGSPKHRHQAGRFFLGVGLFPEASEGLDEGKSEGLEPRHQLIEGIDPVALDQGLDRARLKVQEEHAVLIDRFFAVIKVLGQDQLGPGTSRGMGGRVPVLALVQALGHGQARKLEDQEGLGLQGWGEPLNRDFELSLGKPRQPPIDTKRRLEGALGVGVLEEVPDPKLKPRAGLGLGQGDGTGAEVDPQDLKLGQLLDQSPRSSPFSAPEVQDLGLGIQPGGQEAGFLAGPPGS